MDTEDVAIEGVAPAAVEPVESSEGGGAGDDDLSSIPILSKQPRKVLGRVPKLSERVRCGFGALALAIIILGSTGTMIALYMHTRVHTYRDDNRMNVNALLDSFESLHTSYGWKRHLICDQNVTLLNGKETSLPLLVYTTPISGPSVWLLSGIYGENPAGPDALANSIDHLVTLGTQHPVVLFPVCNPGGYACNQRYPDEVHSVGDSSWLLPNLTDPNQPRASTFALPETGALTEEVVSLAALKETYPILFAVDLQEDITQPNRSYVVSMGAKGREDLIAHQIIATLNNSGLPPVSEGITIDGRPIHQGLVGPSHDSSIDELLAAPLIIVNETQYAGPSAKSVLRVATPAGSVELSKRITAQINILKSMDTLLMLYRVMWGM